MEKDSRIPFALYFCVLLIAVFMLQVFTPFNPGFQAYESHWINFFLSFFGHSNGEHLINNLFFLGLFGTLYELWTSRKTFIYTFLISAIFANITAFIFYTDSFIIGASGGAMGVLSALAVYRPKKIGLAMGVPVPMYVVLFVYIMINLAGIGSATGTAYEAHLFGLFTGVLIGLWLRDNEGGKKYGKNISGPGKKSGRAVKNREDRVEKEKKRSQKSKKEDRSKDEDIVEEDWDERITEWEKKYMMD